MSDFERELEVALEAAREAGAEVMRLRRDGLRVGRKSYRELVSEADIVAAEMLHHAIAGAFPGDGWLSEEHVDSADRLGRDRVWIVDPIDGTREYLQGVPEFAVSIGLAVEGAPVLGVVHNPATGEMFAATCPGAAELPPVDVPDPYTVLVGHGEAHWDEVPPLPRTPRVAGMGSVAYRLAKLANGTGDVVVTNYGRAEWDVAAGIALCLAAGLRATDVLGEAIVFNKPDPDVRGLLAAAPALHDHISGYFSEIMRRR